MNRGKVKGIILICVIGVLIITTGKFTNEDYDSRDAHANINFVEFDDSGEKLIEKTYLDRDFQFEDITYRNGEFYISKIVYEVREDFKKEDDYFSLDGKLFGKEFKVKDKIYVQQDKLQLINVNRNNQIIYFDEEGKENSLGKVTPKLLELKVIGKGKYELLSEKDYKIGEENIFKEFFMSDEDRDNKIYKGIREEKITEIIKNYAKQENSNFIQSIVKGSKGRYSNMILTNEDEMNNFGINYYRHFIVNNENEEVYDCEDLLERGLKEIFEHENKLYCISEDGDLLGLEIEDGQVKIKNTYKNSIGLEKDGWFPIIGIDDECVYIKSESIVNKLIYSINLKTKEFNTIYVANLFENLGEFYGGYNNYILFAPDLKNTEIQSIGKLDKDIIEEKILGINFAGNIEVYYSDEYVLIIRDELTHGVNVGKIIEVYSLK